MSEVETEIQPVAGSVASSGLSALRMVANWVIAGVSLVVIGGFVYWTVNLGTRDPREVPIIRAMEGPSRVAPEDPGGRKARHQGLAVNAVQSDGWLPHCRSRQEREAGLSCYATVEQNGRHSNDGCEWYGSCANPT